MARSKTYYDERPRINLALEPDVYKGSLTLAHISEMSLTAFINETLRRAINQNSDLINAVAILKKGSFENKED